MTAAIGNALINLLTAKAEDLRKSQPNLTREQAFAKVYEDPDNAAITQAERAANRPVYPPIARIAPTVGATDGLTELQRLAAEFRSENPTLTPEQAFERVYSDPSNRDLARLERKQNRPTA